MNSGRWKSVAGICRLSAMVFWTLLAKRMGSCLSSSEGRYTGRKERVTREKGVARISSRECRNLCCWFRVQTVAIGSL